jgi:hypothetical protein
VKIGKFLNTVDKKYLYVLGLTFIVIGVMNSVIVKEIDFLALITGLLILIFTHKYKRNG